MASPVFLSSSYTTNNDFIPHRNTCSKQTKDPFFFFALFVMSTPTISVHAHVIWSFFSLSYPQYQTNSNRLAVKGSLQDNTTSKTFSGPSFFSNDTLE